MIHKSKQDITKLPVHVNSTKKSLLIDIEIMKEYWL